MSVKINNNISMPTDGKINNFNVNSSNISFFIKKNYIYPINKIYKINLQNIFSIKQNNVISIKIKLPKYVSNQDYSFIIKDFPEEITGGINIKSSNGDFSKKLSKLDNTIKINDYCGWTVIELLYLTELDICNICDISYSLCFEPFKLHVIKSICSRSFTTIPLDNIEVNLNLINCDLSIEPLDDIEVKNGDVIEPNVLSNFDINRYEWIGSNNFTTNTLNLDITEEIMEGEYTIKVVDIYGCTAEESFMLSRMDECIEIVATYTIDSKKNIIIEITQPMDGSIEYEYNKDSNGWTDLPSDNKISGTSVNTLLIRYKNNINCGPYTVNEI